MAKILTYLTFNGNCKEAMAFYQHCLGGELKLQIIGESPMADKLPNEMKNLILHAKLQNDRLILLGSDMVGDDGLVKGNAISIMVECTSEPELLRYYEKLSEGGKATHPVETSFWGTLFGGLTDKFGNRWLLSF